MLLKTFNRGAGCVVVDPCEYPFWIQHRYHAAGITYLREPAETVDLSSLFSWDEAWVYNVLQHVEDPELIIHRMRRFASVIRIFEWIDLPPHLGHPHELKAPDLARWLGGPGKVEQMNTQGCVGRAFYGAFPTGRTDG
jgi:hypothetical protein